MNTYTTTIRAVCPVDKLPDVYRLTVRSTRTIPVEDILAAAAKATAEPRYQEDITAAVARALGAEASTVGWHSGVTVESVSGGVS